MKEGRSKKLPQFCEDTFDKCNNVILQRVKFFVVNTQYIIQDFCGSYRNIIFFEHFEENKKLFSIQ